MNGHQPTKVDICLQAAHAQHDGTRPGRQRGRAFDGYQDDSYIHGQPFPELVLEEQEIYSDHNGYQQQDVKDGGRLASHLVRPFKYIRSKPAAEASNEIYITLGRERYKIDIKVSAEELKPKPAPVIPIFAPVPIGTFVPSRAILLAVKA